MIEHDLTQDELAFLDSQCKKGTSRWRWINTDDGRLRNPIVEIVNGEITAAAADGEHSTIEIVHCVYDAARRRSERRSAAAKKASATRARRREKFVYQTAALLRQDALDPRSNCRICGRGLNDAESIARGVGTECWQAVLENMYRQRRIDDATTDADLMTEDGRLIFDEGTFIPKSLVYAVAEDFDHFMRWFPLAARFNQYLLEHMPNTPGWFHELPDDDQKAVYGVLYDMSRIDQINRGEPEVILAGTTSTSVFA